MIYRNTNNLLHAAGITGKSISSTAELTRVASSMFVTIFESLFKVRLEGVIRGPKTRDAYIHNVERVISSLSEHIRMDLKHIKGKSIVQGELRALSNLIHIFVRIVAIAGQESQSSIDHEGDDGVVNESQDVDSISTHESTFGVGHIDGPKLTTASGAFRLSASKGRRIWELDAHKLLSTTEEQLQHDTELERNWQSRGGGDAVGGYSKPWVIKASEVYQNSKCRFRSSEEHIMLRKIYCGLLEKMTVMGMHETMEARDRVCQLRDEAKAHMQSLQREFEDRHKMLKQQIKNTRYTADRHAEAQSRVGAKLRRVHAERQERIAQNQRDTSFQRRHSLLIAGREAHRNLNAFLRAEENYEF